MGANGVGDPTEEDELRSRLSELRARHRHLDSEIIALEALDGANQFVIRRLKKEKLQVKDQITQLEDRLFPDIIA